MKRIFSLLLNRLFIVGILILLQVTWILVTFLTLSNYNIYFQTFFTILSILVALWIINKKDNPAYKLAWIVPILLFPVLGGMMYLFLGNKNPSKRLRRKLERTIRRSKHCLNQSDAVMQSIMRSDPHVGRMANYVSAYNGYPIYHNSTAEYFPTGEACYEVMLEELKKAKHYIFMEYFIVEEGQMFQGILDILCEKVKEGVEVRFMYDDVGSISVLPYHYYKKLEAMGIKSMAFNPFRPIFSLAMNNRDHRKILVIDGHTAFSGGINLADEYINAKERFGYWKDNGIMLKGEAVWNFTVMFLQMWNAAATRPDLDFDVYMPHVHSNYEYSDGYIQPYGDSPLDDEVVGENVYLNIINQAVNYVYIFTPYLIIDNEMTTALCLASKRGVDVRIVTPDIPDKKIVFLLTRSYYPQLLEAGVLIYQYTPGFIHSKCFVCDDKVATVGTINLDYRSLYLHFECGIFMYKSHAVMEVKQDALETIQASRRITPEDNRQGFFIGLFQAVLRVFAPLL